jgi:hypothetical protein
MLLFKELACTDVYIQLYLESIHDKQPDESKTEIDFRCESINNEQ